MSAITTISSISVKPDADRDRSRLRIGDASLRRSRHRSITDHHFPMTNSDYQSLYFVPSSALPSKVV